MSHILITSIPPGEAPQSVREAWVGLKLKVSRGQSKVPIDYNVLGVRTQFSGWRYKLAKLLGLPSARSETWSGYAVEFLPALWSLEQAGRAEAGVWWCKNAPHLLQPEQTVVFPAFCCAWQDADA